MGRRGVFRVNRAIQKLERGAKWLAEARALAKEGTLEALLAYIRWAEEKMKEMRGRLERLEEDADKIRRSLFYRWFGLVRLGRFSWIRRSTFENRISRILEDARKQAANAEAEWSRALDRFPKRVIWFNAFRDTWPDALRRLEALGFRLNTRVMFETEKQAEKDVKEQTALA